MKIAFQGISYKYLVSLSLSLRKFINRSNCLAIYLDNWLLLACLEQEAVTHLANLGFVVNKEKIVLKPKQDIALLGLTLNVSGY